ncbi:MAG: hypothetical protein ACREVV_05820 [Steroidobacteraceae bacterium]
MAAILPFYCNHHRARDAVDRIELPAYMVALLVGNLARGLRLGRVVGWVRRGVLDGARRRV